MGKGGLVGSYQWIDGWSIKYNVVLWHAKMYAL